MLLLLNSPASDGKEKSNFFSSIFSATRRLLKAAFVSEYEIMSDEVREILSNPEDREKFMDAVDKIKNSGSQKESVKLEDGTILTLVP